MALSRAWKLSYIHPNANCTDKTKRKVKVTAKTKLQLEDLKVLRHSPDLFNNVKIGQGFTAKRDFFHINALGIKFDLAIK